MEFGDVVVPRKSIDDASPAEWDKVARGFYSRPEDPNVDKVVESYLDRAEEGMKKYQVTTERTDIDLLGWLNHLQEELMDATIYLERVKRELE